MEKKRNTLPVTALLMMKKENKILLMRRYNTGYEDGKYCFPGGHVEKSEEIKKAVIREAKEEIGVDIKDENIKFIHVLNRKVKDNAYIDFIFECSEWKGEINIMEKNRADELKWFDINNIPTNILPFMNEVLKKENEFYISYGWEE